MKKNLVNSTGIGESTLKRDCFEGTFANGKR